jgi:hypothetical protein
MNGSQSNIQIILKARKTQINNKIMEESKLSLYIVYFIVRQEKI